jgi:hypothetical protein
MHLYHKKPPMEIKSLAKRTVIEKDEKLNLTFAQFQKLLSELRKQKLTNEIIEKLNVFIEELNSTHETEFKKQLKLKQTKIVKLLEKELKIVPKNYYRNIWLAVGMAAFGVPIGVSFGLSMGNLGLLGLGLPIGMAIGIAIGTGMDKKAFEEGRQLDVVLK